MVEKQVAVMVAKLVYIMVVDLVWKTVVCTAAVMAVLSGEWKASFWVLWLVGKLAFQMVAIKVGMMEGN